MFQFLGLQVFLELHSIIMSKPEDLGSVTVTKVFGTAGHGIEAHRARCNFTTLLGLKINKELAQK